MTEPSLSLLGALMIGLLGSAHCVGMCGGVSASLSMALPVGSGFRWRQLQMVLLFNLGRIGSYMLVATLLAATGQWLVDYWADLQILLRSIAGMLLILMGLALGRWWQGIRMIEKPGQNLWRRIAPLAKPLLPVRKRHQALLLGMLWGWLPCGLLYSTLAWAALQPSALDGALLMLAFGVGTLPSMLLTGLAASSFDRFRQQVALRQTAALLFILFGLWTLPFTH